MFDAEGSEPWADDKSRDVFGQSASVEGFPANGRLDRCNQGESLIGPA